MGSSVLPIISLATELYLVVSGNSVEVVTPQRQHTRRPIFQDLLKCSFEHAVEVGSSESFASFLDPVRDS